jgi:hypothetical protein
MCTGLAVPGPGHTLQDTRFIEPEQLHLIFCPERQYDTSAHYIPIIASTTPLTTLNTFRMYFLTKKPTKKESNRYWSSYCWPFITQSKCQSGGIKTQDKKQDMITDITKSIKITPNMLIEVDKIDNTSVKSFHWGPIIKVTSSLEQKLSSTMIIF